MQQEFQKTERTRERRRSETVAETLPVTARRAIPSVRQRTNPRGGEVKTRSYLDGRGATAERQRQENS